MKKINAIALIFTLSAFLFCNTINAQTLKCQTDWNTLFIEYAPGEIYDTKDNDIASQSFNRISIGWKHAFSLSNSIPLYIETGLGFQYMFFNIDYSKDSEGDYYEDYGEIQEKYTILALNIPLNIGYNFCFSNENVNLMPYIGLDFRLNVFGRDTYKDAIFKKNFNLFSNKDMQIIAPYTPWKRFQAGWHIGANLQINKRYNLNVSYGGDFSELMPRTKTRSFKISAGIRF